MGVHRDTRLPVAGQPVADNDIIVDRGCQGREGRRAGRGEKPNADAVSRDGQTVFRGFVIGDRIVEDPIRSPAGTAVAGAALCDARVMPQS
jgi:hypothetical protein